jgi:hypothetical protein
VLEVGTENRPKRVDDRRAAGGGSRIGDAHPRLTAVFHGGSLSALLPSIRVPENTSWLEARRRSWNGS